MGEKQEWGQGMGSGLDTRHPFPFAVDSWYGPSSSDRIFRCVLPRPQPGSGTEGDLQGREVGNGSREW